MEKIVLTYLCNEATEHLDVNSYETCGCWYTGLFDFDNDKYRPRFATRGSVGLDLFANLNLIGKDKITINKNERIIIDTSIRIDQDVDSGMVFFVCSRSGLAKNEGVVVLNSPGVIDTDYKDSIKVILQNHGDNPYTITDGNKIAQLLFYNMLGKKYSLYTQRCINQIVTKLERPLLTRKGGFGSTGI